MVYYAGDGLPQWYYDLIGDKELMRELKERVFKDLSENGEDTAVKVSERLDISIIFEDEVEGFISSWREAQAPKQIRRVNTPMRCKVCGEWSLRGYGSDYIRCDNCGYDKTL